MEEKIKELIKDFWSDKYKVVLLFVLIFLSIFSVYVLHPRIAGDGLLYTSSIQVLETGVRPAGFVPMMIVSTYLGLRLIMLLDLFTRSIAVAWILLDSLLYILMGLFFYSLLKRIFIDSKTAFIGTLLLVTNYAAITFGLGYLMDMGGWAAYVASLYFSYRYLESAENADKWLYTSSLIVGIGGLYKEYSFVAYAVIFGLIIYKNWGRFIKMFGKVVLSWCLAFLPFIVLNIYGFLTFHYTYLDWIIFNHGAYAYQNRLVEFIKSFGSIYTFGWFLFVGGLYIFLKQTKKMLEVKIIDKNILFIWLTVLSCSAVLVWPVVTRVLFITMPAAVLISSILIKKINNKMYIIIPLLVLYIISGYLMDSFILNFVNLPI